MIQRQSLNDIQHMILTDYLSFWTLFFQTLIDNADTSNKLAAVTLALGCLNTKLSTDQFEAYATLYYTNDTLRSLLDCKQICMGEASDVNVALKGMILHTIRPDTAQLKKDIGVALRGAIEDFLKEHCPHTVNNIRQQALTMGHPATSR